MAATETAENVTGRSWPVLAVGLVTLATVAALLVVPSTPSLVGVATLSGIVLVALLAVIAVTEGVGPLPAMTVALVAATATAWAVLAVTDPVVATLVIVGGLTLVSYGLHRYELVALGLVEVTDE